VAYLVAGHDVTIAMAAEAGQMELNAFEPVAFYNLFESIEAMEGAVRTLTDHCITGIRANRARCRSLMESSAGVATALSPYLGYKKSAEIAKQAVREDRTVREIVLTDGLMTEQELSCVLDPWSMTGVRAGTRQAM
jgi:aspartate ammonia-lyase